MKTYYLVFIVKNLEVIHQPFLKFPESTKYLKYIENSDKMDFIEFSVEKSTIISATQPDLFLKLLDKNQNLKIEMEVKISDLKLVTKAN